jgi:hypothetical protein
MTRVRLDVKAMELAALARALYLPDTSTTMQLGGRSSLARLVIYLHRTAPSFLQAHHNLCYS